MKEISINLKWCKGCGICAEFCPKNVLSISGEKARVEKAEECIGCRMCEYRCPDMAITVREGN